MLSLDVRVLLTPVSGHWVAQCLEYDIAEDGASVSEAKDNFCAALEGHLQSDLTDNQWPLRSVADVSKRETTERVAMALRVHDKMSMCDDAIEVSIAWFLDNGDA